MKKLVIVILFLTFAQQIIAQKANQFNGWIFYIGNHKITDKWGLHTEFQWRRNDGFSDPMQNQVRLGIDYNFNKKISTSIGWSYIESSPYGDFENEIPAKFNQYKFNEQRIWEQLIINHENAGRFLFDSRFRLEQRFIANFVNISGAYLRPTQDYMAVYPNTEDWKYRQRVRYRFRTQVPLTNSEMKNNTLFFVASDEIFANFGKNVGANIFDQNRLYFALGWRFNKDCNIQAGYLNQFIEKSDGAHKENNNTMQLALTYNIDFRKLFKK